MIQKTIITKLVLLTFFSAIVSQCCKAQNLEVQPVSFDFSNLSDTIFQFRNLTGTFKALYQDGSSEIVDISNANCQLNNEKEGKQTANISWHSYSQTYDVYVAVSTRRPLMLNLSRVKSELLIFERLKGTVKALYSDGTYDIFDVQYADFEFNNDIVGRQKVKVSWHGCSATLAVNVKNDPAKPSFGGGVYQLETVASLKWFIRAMVAGGTDGYDADLTTKLFEGSDKYADILVPKIESFTLVATVAGVAQNMESNSSRFTNSQRQLLKSTFNNDGKIIIENAKAKTTSGQLVDLGNLCVEP